MRRLVCWFIVGCLCVGPAVSWAGFVLHKSGDVYSLSAEQARLASILAEIDRIEPAALRFLGNQEGVITATYPAVTLDELLYRLGVSYVLVYEPDEQGSYHLDDAMLLGSDADAMNPELRSRINKLIHDLRDDDIAWNADRAYYDLIQIGCEAAPLLEQALYSDDYQERNLAALSLHYGCADHNPSERMLEVMLELMSGRDYDYELWNLFQPTAAYHYFSENTGVYERVRSRLVGNLNSPNRRERLLSALLLAERGETDMASSLVHIMAPHLADNDLKSDAAAVSYALYQLGPRVLPYLSRFRNSKDVQQAEMATLICRALEEGRIPAFNPVMYVGFTRNPVAEKPWVDAKYWDNDKFPDEFGVYRNLDEHRHSAADYYGPGYLSQYPFSYTVQEGDTLETVSRAFIISEGRLREENPGVHEPIPVGAVLQIPADW